MKLNSSILKKLAGNIFGLLLLTWLFVVFIGNFDSIFALLEDKKTVYFPECLESSYDVRGSYCEEYGDGQVLTIKDTFIHSLWTASIITGGLALIILIGYIISEAKYRLSK